MQDKDITQKVLEKYNDVFADILNVLLFNGRDVVEESTLIDALPMSMLKIDGRVLGYDGAEYVKQSRKENIDKAKYPVIT